MNKMHTWAKALDTMSYVFLFATILFVPLFLDSRLVNFYVVPKQYAFFALVIASLLAWAGKIVVSKKVVVRRTVFDLPILALLAACFLSALVSVARLDSFLGRSEYFAFHFLLLVFLAFFFFLLVQHLSNYHRWTMLVDGLVAVGGVTAGIFFLKTVVKVDLFARWFPNMWSLVDVSNNSFGVWLAVLFLIAAGAMIRKNIGTGRAILYSAVTIITFLSIVLLNFTPVLWTLLIGLVLLLAVGTHFVNEARVGWLSVLFAGLVITVLLIFFGAPSALKSLVPTEVSLNRTSSLAIASRTVFDGVKNFLLGSGPGTFVVDFSQFRQPEFNNDSAAWALRFNRPLNTVLALLGEIGVVPMLTFIFLILTVLGHAISSRLHYVKRGWQKAEELMAVLHPEGEKAARPFEVFLLMVPWAALTTATFFVFFGPTLWWLWWLLLGLIVTGLAFFNPTVAHTNELTLEDTPQHNLSFSFLLIIVIAAGIIAGVWGGRLYVGEIRYAKALSAPSPEEAERLLNEATSYRSTADSYHAGLAQVYLLQAVAAAQGAAPDVQKVSVLVSQAVNAARRATSISPQSVTLWENLATMYENAAALVPEARDWAIKTLEEARKLEPTSPVLAWRLGNNYALAGKWNDAIKFYEEAVALKRDYVGAYVSLAGAYEQTKQIDKAIAIYTSIFSVAQENVEYLFNFGRLLYNRNSEGDRSAAEQLWLAAVQRQPNFSNALFSLGVLYEARGERATALEYYYKVKDLNPNNKEIVTKINRLVQ